MKTSVLKKSDWPFYCMHLVLDFEERRSSTRVFFNEPKFQGPGADLDPIMIIMGSKDKLGVFSRKSEKNLNSVLKRPSECVY